VLPVLVLILQVFSFHDSYEQISESFLGRNVINIGPVPMVTAVSVPKC